MAPPMSTASLLITSIFSDPYVPLLKLFIGGCNSQQCLRTAERYIPEEDRWEERALYAS